MNPATVVAVIVLVPVALAYDLVQIGAAVAHKVSGLRVRLENGQASEIYNGEGTVYALRLKSGRTRVTVTLTVDEESSARALHELGKAASG